MSHTLDPEEPASMALEVGMVVPSLEAFEHVAKAFVEQGGQFQALPMMVWDHDREEAVPDGDLDTVDKGRVSFAVLCANSASDLCPAGVSACVSEEDHSQFVVEGLDDHAESCIALQEELRLNGGQHLRSPGPTEAGGDTEQCAATEEQAGPPPHAGGDSHEAVRVGKQYHSVEELEDAVQIWHAQKYPKRYVTKFTGSTPVRRYSICRLQLRRAVNCPWRIRFEYLSAGGIQIVEATTRHSAECAAHIPSGGGRASPGVDTASGRPRNKRPMARRQGKRASESSQPFLSEKLNARDYAEYSGNTSLHESEDSSDPPVNEVFREGAEFGSFQAINTAIVEWHKSTFPGETIKRYFLRQGKKDNKPTASCRLREIRKLSCPFYLFFHPKGTGYVLKKLNASHSAICNEGALKEIDKTASVSARTSRDQLHTSPGDMEAPLKAKSHERSSGPKPKASPRKRLPKLVANQNLRAKEKSPINSRLTSSNEDDDDEGEEAEAEEYEDEDEHSDSMIREESDQLARSDESSSSASSDDSEQSSSSSSSEGDTSDSSDESSSSSSEGDNEDASSTDDDRMQSASETSSEDEVVQANSTSAPLSNQENREKREEGYNDNVAATNARGLEALGAEASTPLATTPSEDTVKPGVTSHGPVKGEAGKGQHDEAASHEASAEETSAQLKKPFREMPKWPKSLVDRLELHSLYCTQDLLDAGIGEDDTDEIWELVTNEEPFDTDPKRYATKVQLYMAKKHMMKFLDEVLTEEN